MSGVGHVYPDDRYSDDGWESQEAAAAQLRREVIEARRMIQAADAEARGKISSGEFLPHHGEARHGA